MLACSNGCCYFVAYTAAAASVSCITLLVAIQFICCAQYSDVLSKRGNCKIATETHTHVT